MSIFRYSLNFLLLFTRGAVISLSLNVGSNSVNSDGPPNTFLPIRDVQIRFFLRTRNINELELTRDNLTSVNFDTTKDTVVLIHGWRDGPNTSMPREVGNAYLGSRDINVVVVDWSKMAASPYVTVALSTTQVGTEIADFIQFLMEKINLDMNRTSLVGHSLGAHVAGVAGRLLNGLVGSITGLDPPGPSFYQRANDLKLTKDDAQFVQVIHTSAGFLGYLFSLGHADYWPNCGGVVQPGCGLLERRCSHDRSFWFYGESLRTGGFQGIQCSDCGSFSLEKCDNAKTATMGNAAVDESFGNFFLTTNSKPPYSMS